MTKKSTKTSVAGKKPPTPAPSAPEPERKSDETHFPIVAIGASAGGLEALTQFLEHVPQNSGLAFVVIQHLDPDHIALLPELLQRVTSMKVTAVKDRSRVRPDSVYVTPPNRDMSILHGVLHLFEASEPRGQRLPIDHFFRSLAEDCKERSIGVILSGMGSDGTLGLRAIKEKGGLTLVQDPDSAKFSGMPNSAISFGLADIVARAENIPGKIMDFLQHTPAPSQQKTKLEDKELSALDKIVILLRSETGNDFSLYKKSTLYRRIERRMGIHQIDSIAGYVRYIQANHQELELLFKEFLIGVTSFFRDPAAWENLKNEVIPDLLASHPEGGVLRAWSAGCSTGEEAYSLAIIFREVLEQVKPKAHFSLQVFATDLDRDAIDKARLGLFLPNIASDVSAERLNRYFVKDEDGYRIKKEIREMVTFATQNVITDPPFTKLDILICRNLLIYLDVEMQKKLLPLFHYVLNPGGVLFLGSAETLGASAELFTAVNAKLRLFRRDNGVSRASLASFPSTFPLATASHKELSPVKPEINFQVLADRILLQKHSPPAVLVNEEGDIVYISARIGKYLEPPVGKANINVFAMAREGLRPELLAAFHKAMRQNAPVITRNIRISGNGHPQTLDLIVQKMEEPELQGMAMIIFKDLEPCQESPVKKRGVKSSDAVTARIGELELELQQTQEKLRITLEELQTTREEMQTSQEELKASNEELQSINEELQSTNEELTTSKEEMQSMNEELQTVNSEQQAKVDELSHLNDDMRNFLNSTEVATIFLDSKLNIRRFANASSKLFKLIPSDVGRPLTDIVNDLSYPELTDDAEAVLRTLVYSEKQVTTNDGRWFSVRIMPYRTVSDVIDGVVITMTDITPFKKLEEELRDEVKKLLQGRKEE
ncbi:MCP methyltransferase/methylesterase, CheR/CheB with PAS/PAC sensor [Geobacter metallireducens RCH3]|uniref:chemotaxis protein CheB n=1 Tax=Geobacter metallireducens TaxID=28232 RepID=UPI00024A522B|nr:chemotaxis protein CheB [Geobacter metallireducens]EHP86028.1 MCP methyltransferase/methylesterase, CheR/CheB with PAS/PAC sensor [Geobacter metallireducens RCH3]